MVKDWNTFEHLKPLELSTSTYLPSKTFINLDSKVANDSIEFKIFQNYIRQLEDCNDSRIKYEIVSGNMSEIFLKRSANSYKDLNIINLFGVSLEEGKVTAWFNNQPWHALPISLNLLHNAVLMTLGNEKMKIELTHKPLPYRTETKVSQYSLRFKSC